MFSIWYLMSSVQHLVASISSQYVFLGMLCLMCRYVVSSMLYVELSLECLVSNSRWMLLCVYDVKFTIQQLTVWFNIQHLSFSTWQLTFVLQQLGYVFLNFRLQCACISIQYMKPYHRRIFGVFALGSSTVQASQCLQCSMQWMICSIVCSTSDNPYSTAHM